MSFFLLVSTALCVAATRPVTSSGLRLPHARCVVHRSHQRPLIPHHRRMPAEGEMGHRRRSQKGSPEDVPTRNTRHVRFAAAPGLPGSRALGLLPVTAEVEAGAPQEPAFVSRSGRARFFATS